LKGSRNYQAEWQFAVARGEGGHIKIGIIKDDKKNIVI